MCITSISIVIVFSCTPYVKSCAMYCMLCIQVYSNLLIIIFLTAINECQNGNYNFQQNNCLKINGSDICVCSDGLPGSNICSGMNIFIRYHK